MMKNQQKRLILSLFVTGLLVLSACTGTNATPAGGMTEGTQSGNVPSTSGEGEIDVRFIDMMVPHHQGAVEMAKIALERSERPEIQGMANAIIASQEEEISMMRGWKQEWYGSSDTPPMSAMPMMEAMEGMGGMGHPMNMQAEVDALRSAPEPFDLAFIDSMIPHHQSAVDAAEMVLDTAAHSEMREMAKQVIDEQQKEIDQMKAWRTEWYPDAPALK